jgi:DNA-binding NtrC family response regulator
MTDVLLLERDLFFVAKVRETLKAAGRACQVAKTAEDFTARLTTEPRPVAALVHFGAAGIDWATAIGAARDAGVPVLAYGSHIDIANQTTARAAGATRVIANSKLAGDLVGQIDQTIARVAATFVDEDTE